MERYRFTIADTFRSSVEVCMELFLFFVLIPLLREFWLIPQLFFSLHLHIFSYDLIIYRTKNK